MDGWILHVHVKPPTGYTGDEKNILILRRSRHIYILQFILLLRGTLLSSMNTNGLQNLE